MHFEASASVYLHHVSCDLGLQGNKNIPCPSRVKVILIVPDAFSALDLRWLDMILRYASYLSRNPVKIATTTIATTIDTAILRVLEH
ncbi:hypothetical protein AUEXF2481DRAFT_44347, partial [Aureobasidium subglaciale EXF-2481]